jgi:integrase
MDHVMDTNSNTLKESTRSTYDTQISKLKKFRPKLSLGEIDKQFIDEYTNYMVGLGNNHNTISKARAWIKAQLNRAVDLKKISRDDVDPIEVSRIKGNREFLTIEEINKLEALLASNKLKRNLHQVLKYFLFCCYTGLRYSDIKILKYKHILDNATISIVMHKTGEPVRIPLIDQAKKFIGNGLPEQKIFRVFTDQPTNRYLKEIMKLEDVKINKSISFHCARHTFATMAITIGIPIEVISRILGHTELSTTQIYAKIEDPLKEKEMKKFNEINTMIK